MAERTKDDYLYELEEVRDKLVDYIDLMNQGKINYYKDAALKLRVLYCYKSGTPSLLKKVSDLFGFEFYVYIQISPQELGIFKNPPIFEFNNSVLSWLDRGKQGALIFDAIKRHEIQVVDRKFSYKEIIEVVADKMVAHIDPKIDDGHLELHSQQVLLFNLPIAQRAIYDTANTSIKVINIISDYIRHGTQSKFIKSTGGLA